LNLQMCIDTNQEANLLTCFELSFLKYTVTYRTQKYSTTAIKDGQQNLFHLTFITCIFH